MTSQVTFGTLRAELHGSGKVRSVRLYAGEALVQELSVADIRNKSSFDALSDRQMVLVRKWVASHRAARMSTAAEVRRFPKLEEVLSRFSLEARGQGGVTINAEHGKPGDEDYCEGGDISSKAVTDWYVKEYCRMNHLTT